jgi:hydrogenase nickel incorporation protein HypB
VMFRSVDLVLVNKMDLLPHLDFDLGLFEHHLRQVNPHATVLRLSARTADGLDAWLAWLDDRLDATPDHEER